MSEIEILLVNKSQVYVMLSSGRIMSGEFIFTKLSKYFSSVPLYLLNARKPSGQISYSLNYRGVMSILCVNIVRNEG